MVIAEVLMPGVILLERLRYYLLHRQIHGTHHAYCKTPLNTLPRSKDIKILLTSSVRLSGKISLVSYRTATLGQYSLNVCVCVCVCACAFVSLPLLSGRVPGSAELKSLMHT